MACGKDIRVLDKVEELYGFRVALYICRLGILWPCLVLYDFVWVCMACGKDIRLFPDILFWKNGLLVIKT